jgi:hypothetical protein
MCTALVAHNGLGMFSCELNNGNMELKQRIIRNLEWANKRLKLQGKELDETQLEIIEFCLLHDLQQLNTPCVVGQSEQLPRCEHKNIKREDDLDECLDCGVSNY